MAQSNTEQLRAASAGGETQTTAYSMPICGPRLSHFMDRVVSRLFEDRVSQMGDKLAVICADRRLTFAELNGRANQLARHLRAQGIGADSLVGICVDRSLEMAVGILAILKAGGAYLPLDPDYPPARLAFM